MRALVQRVSRARVLVDGRTVGEIGRGLLVFLGVGAGDGERDVEWIARKIVGLRIFEDERGRFEHSVEEVGGGLLVVSQFTLFADTRKGRRPSFSGAAEPREAERLYRACLEAFERLGLPPASGLFGARMQVELTNDGPVTVWLDSRAS
ncbi:MAG: D-aminoacyl-tRNA deacylase [Candidatus Binatia bacterium]|nr:MAG: D-aminoacyl-tRNA deacylase [Candidatus Binatia bacterium]